MVRPAATASVELPPAPQNRRDGVGHAEAIQLTTPRRSAGTAAVGPRREAPNPAETLGPGALLCPVAWGDPEVVVAMVAAGVAALGAGAAAWQAHEARQARTDAQDAATTAETQATAATNQAEAAERSANALEQLAEASRPERARWEVARKPGSVTAVMYRLRNVGTGNASGVTISVGKWTKAPDNPWIQGDSREFMVPLDAAEGSVTISSVGRPDAVIPLDMAPNMARAEEE